LPGVEKDRRGVDIPEYSDSEIANESSDGGSDVQTAKGVACPYEVFAYVLTSLKPVGGSIVQTGCGPNFQGDCITLCTCMRRHRTWLPTWKGVWIAGFTRKSLDNQLFYFTEIGQEAPSMFDLWKPGLLPNPNAKSACQYIHGDVYEPLPGAATNPFDPALYRYPIPNHDHLPTAWEEDICYPKLPISNQPKLLIGIPNRSYLWSRPKYKYNGAQHPRFKFYQSLRDFYDHLV
jgi:hypothetical protein